VATRILWTMIGGGARRAALLWSIRLEKGIECDSGLTDGSSGIISKGLYD